MSCAARHAVWICHQNRPFFIALQFSPQKGPCEKKKRKKKVTKEKKNNAGTQPNKILSFFLMTPGKAMYFRHLHSSTSRRTHLLPAHLFSKRDSVFLQYPQTFKVLNGITWLTREQ